MLARILVGPIAVLGVEVARGGLGLALAVALGAVAEENVHEQDREPGADTHCPAVPAQAPVGGEEDHEAGDHEHCRQPVAEEQDPHQTVAGALRSAVAGASEPAATQLHTRTVHSTAGSEACTHTTSAGRA